MTHQLGVNNHVVFARIVGEHIRAVGSDGAQLHHQRVALACGFKVPHGRSIAARSIPVLQKHADQPDPTGQMHAQGNMANGLGNQTDRPKECW